MPRYRFRWENLDARLLDALSGFADGSDDPVAALRAKFGARPGPELIAAAWKPIREQWLAGNAEALGRVVQRLKKLGLGEGGADVSTADGALEYLRSCRNASTLRTVVLDELLRAGETSLPAMKQPKSAVEWPTFVESLATTLAALGEDDTLILGVKGTGTQHQGDLQSGQYFVQFAAGGSQWLRAEAISNEYLVGTDRLDPTQLERLSELGWRSPTRTSTADPSDDPGGSPNYFRDWTIPVPFHDVAEMAAATLREVLRAVDPGYLTYNAFTLAGETIVLPLLGLQREEPDEPPAPTELAPASAAPPPSNELRARLHEMLATILRVERVVPDNDGDVAINIPNGQLYVRVLDDLPIVRVFTLPLTGVHPSSSLYEAANELNRSYSGLKAVVGNDALFLVADVVAWPFVGDHVQHAMLDVARVTPIVAGALDAKFGHGAALPRTDAGYL